MRQVTSKYINQMNHDTDYAYWTGNTAHDPSKDANAFPWILLTPSARTVFNPLSLIKKSNQLHQLNIRSASRTVQSSFYSTANNGSSRADCCFPHYGRTSSPPTTRDLNFARVFIIWVKTGPPTHLKPCVNISTNTSTSCWSCLKIRVQSWLSKCHHWHGWATLARFSAWWSYRVLSQNHWMVTVGRNFWKSSSASPLLKQVSPTILCPEY